MTGSASSTGALLFFTGPHGYVSPSVHDTTPAVPALDFTTAYACLRTEDRNR